jgi:hypothetical protein
MEELKSILRYWRMVFWETFEEIGIFSAIVATGAGMTAVLLASHFGYAQKGEIPELIFITIVSAIVGVLLEFFIKLFFVTPPKIQKKYESYVVELEEQIRIRELVKPFEVEAICLPHPKTPTCADCFVEIRNPNQTVSDIRFKLIKIEPEMHGPPKSENPNQPPTPERNCYSTKHLNLSSVFFTFSDAQFDSLNEDEKGRIDVFRAICDHFANDLCHKHDQFYKQQAETKNGEIRFQGLPFRSV